MEWAQVGLHVGHDHPLVDFWTGLLGPDLGAPSVDADSAVRVDFEVDDVAAETQRLIGLGATAVARRDGDQALRSPGGWLFGLVHRAPRGDRPAPFGPDGRRTRLVQVCIDAPADLVDREVDFWRAVTDWRYVARDNSDLVGKLFPAPGSPVQLLLQRLGPDDPGEVTRAHVDLGCDDYEATAMQLISLGAERLWAGDGWVTLRDPAGLLFCVTENSPYAPC